MGKTNQDKVINVGIIIGQLVFGGAEKQQVYELVIRLNREKFNPVVFCLSEADVPYGEKIRQHNIKVYTFKRRAHLDVFRLFKLAYLLKKENIDIIHSMLYIGSAYGYFAGKLAGIKAFIPSILGYNDRQSSVVNLINKLVINAPKHVVTNSADLKDYIVQNFQVNPAKVVVIRNGIDMELFNRPVDHELIKRQLGIANNCKIVGIVSRNSAVKNVPLFMAMAKDLVTEDHNICFILAGSGLDKEKKEEWLGSFPLKDNFFFLGTREDIPDLLAIFDVFVLTSLSEGLPNAIMEAFAAGKPVVATNVGGCPELVKDNCSGFLVGSNQTEELVKAVKTILNNKLLAISMGKAGKSFVEENFSMQKMIRETEELYLAVLKSCNPHY